MVNNEDIFNDMLVEIELTIEEGLFQDIKEVAELKDISVESLIENVLIEKFGKNGEL